MNRGPGGNANNRGPGGNASSNNRGPGGNSNTRGNANTRGGNNNANGGSNNANNRGGNNNANNRGGNNNNANNRGGANNANNRGGNNNNAKGGANANNRGGNNNAKGGANANNRGGGNNNNAKGGANNRGGNNNANNRGGGNRPGGANRRQPTGSKTVALKNGGHATFRKDGKVRSIQTKNGMRIDHGMRGQRRVSAEHNGRHVVSYGRHGGGYSQRAYYRHGGHAYVQRTYYRGGRSYAYGYRSYYYGGQPYYGYAPAYYYGPGYYGWAYNPWPQPVYYNWGWGGQPWYGYYGPYYQPYPVYPYAALWLTDYLISANLQAAYQAQAAEENGAMVPPQMGPAGSEAIASLWSSDPLIAASLTGYGSASYLFAAPAAATKGGTQMPADVKQAISDQLKKEIAAEKTAAANKDKESDAKGAEEVPAALDPNTRYFVVSTDQDLTTSDGTECALTAGDVVYRNDDTPDDDHMVDTLVKSSKKDECAMGATVGEDVSDLQDMHNSLRQTMDEGLKEMAANAGKKGFPPAPDTKTTTGEVPAPTPDANVADDLQATQKDADQAEADANQN